jgi:tetratricopeptide (TPR) repeat protein
MATVIHPGESGRGSASAQVRTLRFELAALALAALAALLPQTASALAFAPTEAEWSTWPAYCQARYLVSGAGVDSEYARRLDPAAVRTWESRLGPDVWYGLHHYCAALIIANRAKAQPDKKERATMLKQVIAEDQFTLSHIPDTHPMHAEIAAHMALAHRDLGQRELALRQLDTAIEGCPTCSIGYQTKAMVYRDASQPAQAREVLEAGDVALEGKSAVIHYLLGLVLVDLKDFPAAQEHARRAYELGYPLPGLRDRLARAGHPL